MIVLGGERHSVQGVETISWLDAPKEVGRCTKTSPRVKTIRSLVAHAVHGKVCRRLRPGGKASRDDLRWARSQLRPGRAASWDFTVDTDGSVVWQNDPCLDFTWHARQLNPVSIGFEMVTEDDGTLYEATVCAAARMVAYLCEVLGIQKQTAWDAVHNRPEAGRIARLDPGRNGTDCVGVFGHRNAWVARSASDQTLVPARGFGDPNDFLFEALVNDHHFERLSFNAPAGTLAEDLTVWRARQAGCGFEGRDLDGLPLTATVRRLRERGFRNGIWADGQGASLFTPTTRETP